MPPKVLGSILGSLPAQDDPNLLIGFGTSDDGAVYRLENGTCLIQTVDFFTPIVDDPEDFGAISAANSLSDVYAMGGRPLTALSIVCYPYKTWPHEMLAAIMAGATRKVHEAGAVVVGGHSVQDAEIKFGLAVTGTAEEDAFWANHTVKPGHSLVLTKPLGTGVLTTAVKQGKMPAANLARAVEEMKRLNKQAAELAAPFGVSAVTDITGFGLIGHLFEMLKPGGLGATIEVESLPLLPHVWDAIKAEAFTAAHKTNRHYVADYDIPLTPAHEEYGQVLYDPQTSGGLLIALPREEAKSLVIQLRDQGHAAAMIGETTASPQIQIR